MCSGTANNIISLVHVCNDYYLFSLGISLLELSCNVELPTGGEKWHLLREGQIPREVTAGINSDTLLAEQVQQ